MNVKKRNPLDKQKFLSGNRQRWFAVLLVFFCAVLFVDAKSDIEAGDYLNFLTITGSVFILGSSLDSALKIQATNKRKNNHRRYNEDEDENYYDP